MFHIGIQSQTVRLERFLDEHDMIDNSGMIMSSLEKISADSNVRSMIEYLYDRDALGDIISRMDEELSPDRLSRSELTDEILSVLNIDSGYRYGPVIEDHIEALEISHYQLVSYDVSGYATMYRFDSWRRDRDETEQIQITTPDEGVTLDIQIAHMIHQLDM